MMMRLFCVIAMLLYFIILIYWHKYQKRDNKSVHYFFVLYSLNLLTIVDLLLTNQMTIWFEWWVFPTLPVSFFFAPAFYQYVLIYINPLYKATSRTRLFLWLPGILHVLVIICFAVWGSSQHMSIEDRITQKNNLLFMRVELITAFSYSLALIIISYQKLISFNHKLKQIRANTELSQYNWLFYMPAIAALIWLVWVSFIGVGFQDKIQYDEFIPLLVNLSLLFMIFGYFAVIRPYNRNFFIQVNKELGELDETVQLSSVNKSFSIEHSSTTVLEQYNLRTLTTDLSPNISFNAENELNIIGEHSTINRASILIAEKKNIAQNDLLETGRFEGVKIDKLQSVFQDIEKWMNHTEAYKNENFSLPELAAHTNQSSSVVSKAIKYTVNKNFYTYINEYRIKAFLQVFLEERNDAFTIMALAKQCGFTSKATFHKYFKDLTGMTPIEYRTDKSNYV